MPLMKLSASTMQQVRAKRPKGLELSGKLLRLVDGSFIVSVEDVIMAAVAAERVPGESDDGVMSRLLRAPGLIPTQHPSA